MFSHIFLIDITTSYHYFAEPCVAYTAAGDINHGNALSQHRAMDKKNRK